MLDVQNFANAKQALAEYYNLSKTNVGKYSLELMRELLQALGNPQNKFRVIHVAGTSGKTSTAYYAAALAHGAGLKVGLTVSPHVVEINDRVQINGTPLPEHLFCAELQEFLQIVQAHHLRPSYFELMMAFAFWEFDRQKVDCAVIEVGLGGMLDASNTIDREDKICIITDIGLDHTAVLGNTYGEIAEQKAGIIGLKNSVFCFQQRPDVMRAFKSRAQTKHADLHIISSDEIVAGVQQLPLFQQRNFTLALEAVTFLCESMHYELSRKAIEQALLIHIPGRMETKKIGNKTVIIDGAHNQQKIASLIKSVEVKYPGARIAALVAFGDKQDGEKRMREGLAELRPYVDSIIATTFLSTQDLPIQGIPPERIARVAHDLGFKKVEATADINNAWRKLLAQPQDICLVVGSFYLLNDIRPKLYTGPFDH